MSVEDTIFRGLTHENENAVTELLVNMMQIDDDTRGKILTKLLKETKDIKYDNIKDTHIYTQNAFISKDNICIPDIFIESKDCFIIIESKISRERGLEETQKDAYIELIEKKKKESKKVAYIFLVPKNSNSDDEVSLLMNQKAIDFISKSYWSDILNILKPQKKDNKDVIWHCYQYIKELVYGNEIDSDLLGKIDNSTGYKNIYEQLSKKTKMMKTIREALETFCTNNNLSYQVNTYDYPPCSFGAELMHNRKHIVYVGCDLSAVPDKRWSIQIDEAHCKRDSLASGDKHWRTNEGKQKLVAFPLDESTFYTTLQTHLDINCTNSIDTCKTVDLSRSEIENFLQDYQLFLNAAYDIILKSSQIIYKKNVIEYGDQFGLTAFDNNENKKIGKFFNHKDLNEETHDSSIFIGFDFTLAESKPDYVFCLAVKKDILKDSSGLEKTDTYNLGNTTFSQSDKGDYYFDGEKLYYKLDKGLLSQSDDKFSSKLTNVLGDLKLLQKTQDETEGAN